MSETIPAMLFFIGSIMVVAGFVAVAGKVVDSGGQLLQSKGGEAAQVLRGSIEIINVNASSTIVVYAENTGSAAYEMSRVNVSIDGQWIGGSVQAVRGNGDAVWDAGEIINFTSSTNLGVGWHEAKIFAGKISSQSYMFKR